MACKVFDVLGPPGTGKTDTIAVALEIFLRRFPKARVAIVSQANVAVDEALKKLKDRYPECDIVRHVSTQAVNTLMDSSKNLTQHARRDDFEKQLAVHLVLPEWATRLRGLFQHACSDDRYLNQRVLKTIVQSSAVYRSAFVDSLLRWNIFCRKFKPSKCRAVASAGACCRGWILQVCP